MLAVALGFAPVTALAATPDAKPATRPETKPRTPKADKAKLARQTGPRRPGQPSLLGLPDPAKLVETAPDPQRGVGSRSVGALPSVAEAEPARMAADSGKASKPEKPEKPEKVTARGAHQKGKPPHKPAATLPADAARATPDRAARQKIADGLTDEDLRAGKDDPELRLLKAAERVQGSRDR